MVSSIQRSNSKARLNVKKICCLSFCFGLTQLVFNCASAANQGDSFKSSLTLSDTIIKIEANPAEGFNYPYYLRIPVGVDKNEMQHLLAETNNTGTNDTLQFHVNEALLQIKTNSLGASLCPNLKIPFLMPAFPRPHEEWKLYTHALDRDVALIDDGEMKRLDLQLIAMIENARKILEAHEISIKEKVLMNGFSASGTFANRFTLIHPERVAGVACGGINGMTALPIAKLNRKKLKYPLGVFDFETIFDEPFHLTEFKSVPQYYYMGELDNNDAALFDDAYSNKERKIIFNVLGKTMIPNRFNRCEIIYAENQVNSAFKIYPNIGHQTEQTVFFDVYTFFKNIMSSD